eukprot:TRINITY_DN547832_c0_g1_i1.p2 TRINITY_DN547832_c0_g1~~TRINITY_DN547832_c0_g1_i1.p2  ORF type:complete len:102 (-),score=16.27 TRINITY_DN547832_c0_g1_i1:101-406(-)
MSLILDNKKNFGLSVLTDGKQFVFYCLQRIKDSEKFKCIKLEAMLFEGYFDVEKDVLKNILFLLQASLTGELETLMEPFLKSVSKSWTVNGCSFVCLLIST